MPDDGITPIVGISLREDGYSVVIVSGFQDTTYCLLIVNGDAYHVPSHDFKGIVKSNFIVCSFTHSIAYQSITIANEKQDSSLVSSVECSNVSDRVRVHKDKSEITRVEDLFLSWFEIPFRPTAPIILICLH